MADTDPNTWFLPAATVPRNPHYTTGNKVTAHVDGADYFEQLRQVLAATDHSVLVSGWRASAHQYLNPTAPAGKQTFMDALRGVRGRGGEVRALIYAVTGASWEVVRRWHWDDNRLFCEGVLADGGEAVLDGRISGKIMSSHHQKFIVARARNGSATAFVGGIDVCLDRWDRPAHDMAPERQRDVVPFGTASFDMPSQPAWHDVQAQVNGPAVQQILDVFRNRWNGATPENPQNLAQFRRRTMMGNDALAAAGGGTVAVQLYQTLPCGTAFFGGGEQTVRLGHEHAIGKAQHYIYIEDQYFWPSSLVAKLADALRRGVHVVVLTAKEFDLPGLSYVHRAMRGEAIGALRAVDADRFRIFHLERTPAEQIYVHSKTMIIDDCYASIGSANCNYRSLTNDSELQLGIVDTDHVTVPFGNPLNLVAVCRFAHEYRCRLWGEHFNVPALAMIDPMTSIQMFWKNAPIAAFPRVKPHLPAPAPVDANGMADLLLTLFIAGVPVPGFLAGVVPPGASEALRPALRVALAGILPQPAILPLVVEFVKGALNPHLTC